MLAMLALVLAVAGCASMPPTGRSADTATDDTATDDKGDNTATSPDEHTGGEWEGHDDPELAPTPPPPAGQSRQTERATEGEWSGRDEWWVEGGRSRGWPRCASAA